MIEGLDVTAIFLAGADKIEEAIADPAVVDAWSLPSVLEDQLVSGLTGHLARGGVWGLSRIASARAPDGEVDFHSAGGVLRDRLRQRPVQTITEPSGTEVPRWRAGAGSCYSNVSVNTSVH